MIILGIDPGTRRIGYGLIEKNAGKLTLLDVGILKINSKDDIGALEELKQEMDALIARSKPSRCVVEKIFFARNQKTVIQVAQARGVILLALKEKGLLILECTPNEMKSRVAGYGLADKKAVKKMVEATLNTKTLKILDDASDALALAIVGSGYWT